MIDWLRSLRMPRKLGRALDILRARWLLRRCRLGTGVAASGAVRAEVGGGATVGARVQFVGGLVPTLLRVAVGAVLSIGDECVLNYGVMLEAEREIRVGRRCMFGSFVRVSDSEQGKAAPVIIGDEVWIAHGAIIQPGVTIGDGAVISAGAVVTQDVPARTMAMGNPARMMSLELARKQAG